MGFMILLSAYQSKKDHEFPYSDSQLHVNLNLNFLDMMYIHLFANSILNYQFSSALIKIGFTFVILVVYFLHSVYLHSIDFKLKILV